MTRFILKNNHSGGRVATLDEGRSLSSYFCIQGGDNGDLNYGNDNRDERQMIGVGKQIFKKRKEIKRWKDGEVGDKRN